jgi:hypothetical protein
MNTPAVASLVRAWVDLYTRGLPAHLRAARRDEVADDLWCQREEAILSGRSVRGLDVEMFLRWLFGLPDDIGWRFAHRGGSGAPAPHRTSTLTTRAIGILAIIGAASWLFPAAYTVIAGPSEAEGVTGASSVVGALAFAGALVGLTWRFQDHLTPTGALVGVFAGLAVVMGIFGAYIFIAVLPIGSAVLLWELGRAGILPRGLTIAHAVTALGMLSAVVAMLIDWRSAADSALWTTLVIPYLLSWVTIGAYVVRGVPEVPAASEPNP